MSEPLNKIQLHPAYSWDCDQCGGENFERAMIRECTPEEAAQAADESGVSIDDPTAVFEMVAFPLDVTCKHCGAEYEAEFNQDDDEFYDGDAYGEDDELGEYHGNPEDN